MKTRMFVLAVVILFGCSKKRDHIYFVNHNPVIPPIEDQIIEEGELFLFGLDLIVYDPDFDTVIIELISGPGNIIDGQYRYQDRIDDDQTNDEYLVEFKVVDDRGGQTLGSFRLIQHDNYSTILNVVSEKLSSGLEALIIDEYSSHPEATERYHSSIAVDSKGTPLIIYGAKRKERTDFFRYATITNDGWISRLIESGGGSYNSIIFDELDVAHICYDKMTHYRGEELIYANYKNGFWVSLVIDTNPSVGLESNIALDSRRKVHISHWSWSREALIYTSNKSGRWASEELSRANWSQTSIAIDRQDYVHIAFEKNEGGFDYINYLTNESGDWVKAIVHQSINPALGIDSEGIVYIVSQQTYPSNTSIYCSIKQDGDWITEVVVDYSPEWINPESRLGMAINNDNSIMIPYTVSTVSGDKNSWTGRLCLATGARGKWQSWELDNRPGYINPVIALDKQGGVHITVIYFLDEKNGVIKYITFDPSKLDQ